MFIRFYGWLLNKQHFKGSNNELKKLYYGPWSIEGTLLKRNNQHETADFSNFVYSEALTNAQILIYALQLEF